MATSTAEKKLDAKIKTAQKKVDTSRDAYNKAKKKATEYQKSMAAIPSEFYSKLYDKWNKTKKADYNAYTANKSALTKLKKQKSSLDSTAKTKKNLAKIATNITEHSKKVDAGENEGKVAVFRTDGKTTEVVYVATTGGESDDTTSDVSTWARDEGAPAKNYARVSAKTISMTGIITGDTDAESREKYNKLLQWNSRHYELTYKGKVYYKHLTMTDINRTYDDYETNIKITLTFQFAYTAKVSTDSGTKKTNTTTTSKKTVAGSRSKTYKSLTIKSGMTYYDLSKKYGKSVKWLESVNKYPANSLPIGKKIRVA